MAMSRTMFLVPSMREIPGRGTVSIFLDRYQRVLFLFLLAVLLLLVVVVSGMIIRQQSKFLEESLARRGAVTLQHLARLAPEPFVHKRWPQLQEMAQIARETDDDILGIGFYSRHGKRLLATGDVGALPIPAENIPSVVSTRDYLINDERIFISPIDDGEGQLLGLSYLRQSRLKVTRMALGAALRLDALILAVFSVIAFLMNALLTKVRRLADQEAGKSRQLAAAYQHLQDMQSQLIEAEKMSGMGRLASSMAHELRNPLGAIKNALYYLRDALQPLSSVKEDPTISEFIELADQEVQGAARIISDLLDFSRGVRLIPAPTDLNATLRHVHAMLDVRPGVHVEMRYADPLPLISVDAERMRQVFVNLMINAIQALPPHGGRLVVRTATDQKENRPALGILIDFDDTGCGIPPENRGKIFEPLFTTKAKGSGLGLPISLAIVKAHGGTLEVVERTGSGTVFQVFLPFRQEAA
jgi:signal transduction histidine kinase